LTFRRLLWPVVGGAILVVFLVAGVFPTRTYLHQRKEIASAEDKVSVLTSENAKLAARVRQLHTDSEVERLAREQYNLVRPGEEAYAILPGPADSAPAEAAPPPVVLEAPTKAKASTVDKVLDALTFRD
jgi:cell division protein FtsB